ncbi:GGDEF domain-containing response regulator [Geopsychrobacter electrodiphilus]|uniref:GGDEF domain-containing response regulator n=1 Tax=Geopsychrobacter electrodiphilus TaxID=225196 RepID=UPI00036EDC27|nr:diguanylate cyclase [Geopsychrobacter electrodiphilus]
MITKGKILVVDDDPNLRKTLADILKVKGYATVIAGTGAEAVAAMEQGGISLALVDLMLPDMSGLEVMAHIKAISPLTETIVLTGHASMDTAIKATSQGAFSYLLKPYNMDDLLQNIKHGVERQQAQEEILRLASFPRLAPNPVIELDSAGGLSYLNPAAEQVFPDLSAQGVSHPLLSGSAARIDALRQGNRQEEAIQEVAIGDATYELRVSFVSEVNLIRIYVTEISQRKRDEREIHLYATTDALTGITNRREFNAILERKVAGVKRYGTPLALAMFDLDHFKLVNDNFGHDVGDDVLRTVSGLVQQNLRATDILARWGGEEFMVLMPHTAGPGAENTAEKLRLAIAEHHFDKVDRLTASFGVTNFEVSDDLASLLKRVDDALYQAKKQGRNRVEILPNEMVSPADGID